MEDEERYVHGDDPYAGSADADIRPDFTSQALGGDDNASSDAAAQLKGAEEGASHQQHDSKSGDGADKMAKAESDVPSDKDGGGFKNNVGANSEGKSGAAGGSKPSLGSALKNKLAGGRHGMKRISPLISIFISLAGGGGLLYGAQATVPYALLRKYKSSFDTIGVINNIRFDSIMSNLIQRVNIGWTAAEEGQQSALAQMASGKFKFTNKQKQRMAEQKIYVNGEGIPAEEPSCSSSLTSYLCYEGTTIVIDTDDGDGDDTCSFQPGDVCSFGKSYTEWNHFHMAYNNGSATWRTAVTTFTKESITNFYKYRGISRALVDLGGSVVNGVDTGLAKLQTHLRSKNPRMKATEADNETKTKQKDGNTVPDPSDNNKLLVKIDRKLDQFDAQFKDKLKNFAASRTDSTSEKTKAANAVAGKVSKVAAKLAKGAKVANLVCQALSIGMVIAQLVYANSTYSLLDIAQNFIGDIEKALAGDAEALSHFTSVIGQQYTEYFSPQRDGYERVAVFYDDHSTEDAYDDPGSMPTVDPDSIDPDDYASKTKIKDDAFANQQPYVGSFMTSPATQTMWSKEVYSGNGDPAVAQFNIFSGFKYLSNALKMGMSNYRRCTLAKIAQSALSFAGTLASIAQCFLPPLVGCVATIVENVSVRVAAKMALRFVLTFVVSQLIAAFIPKIAEHLALTFTDIIGGSSFANAVKDGLNMLSGQADQAGGASVASASSLGNYAEAQVAVQEDRARYEREKYSPFDIRSSNTFFGSIVDKFIPVSSYVGISLSGGIKSFGSLVKSSIASLAPGANAAGIAVNVGAAINSTIKNCPFLESVGGVGDEYCTPYMISDLSTAGSDPADIIAELDRAGQIETNDDGTYVKVKEGSRLERWLEFCGRRSSQFGIADQNIASSLGVDTGSTAGSIASHVPLVGDMMSMINDSRALSNAGLITGEACVTGNGSGTYNQVDGTNINARLEYQDKIVQRKELWEKFKNGNPGGSRGALELLQKSENDSAFTPNDTTIASQLNDSTNGIDQDAYKNKATGTYLYDEQAEYAMIKNLFDENKNNLAWRYSTLYPQFYQGTRDANGYIFNAVHGSNTFSNTSSNTVVATVYDNGVAYRIYAGTTSSPFAAGEIEVYTERNGNILEFDHPAIVNRPVGSSSDDYTSLSKTYSYNGYNFRFGRNVYTVGDDGLMYSYSPEWFLDLNSFDNAVTNTCFGNISSETKFNFNVPTVHILVGNDGAYYDYGGFRVGPYVYPKTCDNSSLVRDTNFSFKLIDPNDGPDAAIAYLDGLAQQIRDLDKEIYDYEKDRAEDYTFDAVISETGTWNETRFFQRFAQDQRLLEDMGMIQSDENPITLAYQHIDEVHPQDNSYLGILARYSGYTKENVQLALDAVDSLNWIAEYSPSQYAPSPAPYVEEPDHEFEGEEYDTTQYLARVPESFFEDRRQRNFAA